MTTPRLTDRVERLLDLVLALRDELAEAGHRVAASTPDLVAAVLASPGGVPEGPVAQPYEELTRGLSLGFRRGAKPELRLRPDPAGGLEVTLERRTASGWLTLEVEWDSAVMAAKGGARLLLRARAPAPLRLDAVLRHETPEGERRDHPAGGLALAPESARRVLDFSWPEGAAPGRPARLLLFLPLQPFRLTLEELRVV